MEMGTKKKIIFISPKLSGFTKTDLNILKKEFLVITNIYNWKNKIFTPLYLIHQFIFLLLNIKATDRIVIEFAGYWSLLPCVIGRLFKVPSVIISHGTDCAYLPSIQYGSFGKRFLKSFIKKSYTNTNLICPVSESLIKIENSYSKNNSEKNQGILSFIPQLKTPFKVIYNGLDINFWSSKKNNKKLNTFITVFSQKQYLRKGGDLIIEIARRFPNYIFTIAGSNKPNFKNIPKNVRFIGHISKEKLKVEYQKSEFYFQLSIFEGFGLSLCEAMLNECIPIGSSSNIIPEIIGKSGVILKNKDVNKLEEIVKKLTALNNDSKKELAILARENITSKFSLKDREKILLETVRELN
tara:strand:+ start:1311 stop:2372 length:1062 start_codon:yes stop_codon:yes gene_type:complete